MPDHAYPATDYLKFTWVRYNYLREWICMPITSILQLILFCSSYLHAGSPVSPSVSKLIAKETPNCSSSLDMDIIQIDSSESEDDIDWGQAKSLERSSNGGVSGQWENTSERSIDQNHDLRMELQRHARSNLKEKASPTQSFVGSRPRSEIPATNLGNSPGSSGREGATYISDEAANNDPQSNGHVEITSGSNFRTDAISTPWGADTTSTSQHAGKRILPETLQPFSKTSSNSSIRSNGGIAVTQQKEPIQVKLSNAYEVDLSKLPQSEHTQKRALPSSLQSTMHKTASEGSRNYMGDNVGWKSDFHTNGIDDRRRVLPLSLVNGKSLTNGQPKASTDSKENDQNFGFHVKSSHSVGASAVDGARRLLPSSLRNEKLITNTAVRSSTNSKDDVNIYVNAGTHRVLPPSLMQGKLVNNSHPVSANDAGSHSGLGEERQIEYDERPIYQEALQNLGQPKLEDDLPEGLLTVSLLKHQKIALAWMVQKEKSVHCAGGILADDQGLGKTVSMIALIQKQMNLQSKFTSDDSHQKRSEALNLDEDDDGVIELDMEKQLGKDDLKRKQAASTSMPHNWRPAAGTLVVCPASVLRQWARELDEKVTSNAKLNVLIYHGGTRTRDPGDLAKYDVVLTTYAIVTNEVPKQQTVDDDDVEQKNLEKHAVSSEFSTSKKRKQMSNTRNKGKKKGKRLKDSHFDYDSGALSRVRWFRVILDEAQTIKNHRTQVARGCCGLRAKRRWCLSGTPIQNSIDDLYSYFRFLKYDPYAVYSSFCNSIKYPISRNASHGYKKLQAVLRTVLLRRTKGTLIDGEPVIKLPPKSIRLKQFDFSPEERSFYLKLEADSRQKFKAYAAAGTVRQNYANILLMLLRLRQACDHPILVKGYDSNTIGKDSLNMASQLPKQMLINLLSQLEASLAICGLCNDPPEDAVVTMCGHVFCYQCVSERLTGDDNLCPAVGCKNIIGTESVFSRATLKSCISDELDNNASTSSSHDDESSIVESGYVSSKIRAALEILNSLCSSRCSIGSKECSARDCSQDRTCENISEFSSGTNSRTNTDAQLSLNPELPAKAIVFSQWTAMLDLVELSLNSSLIQYRRLDGTMSLISRDRAVKEFNTDPEVTVMLMSLKAGNLGLNMVAACHVILLDLWWNPTTEDQAVDRAHRIGQTRPVTVSRLTIKDTVEDRILALQEEKRKMVSSAFGEDQTGSQSTRLTVEDLRYLFMV